MKSPEAPGREPNIESAYTLFNAWRRVPHVTRMLDEVFWDGRSIFNPTGMYGDVPVGTQMTTNKTEDMWWVSIEHPGLPSIPTRVWGLDPGAAELLDALHYYEVSPASNDNPNIELAELSPVSAKRRLREIADLIYRMHTQEAAFIDTEAEINPDNWPLGPAE